jgi:hypothetical protein
MGRGHDAAMRIPSPDAALCACADAAMAVPQRRGVPFPAALGGVLWLPGLGCLAVVATKAVLGVDEADTFPAWIGGGLLYLALRRFLGPRLHADARGWSPEAAARYRSYALAFRERFLPLRIALLGMVVLQALLLAIVLGRVPFAHAAAQTAYLAAAACAAVAAYAACAFPRDPDLRAPVPAAAAA